MSLDEGDKWSVKLDVRDLGGHLDTTFRGLVGYSGYAGSAGHCPFSSGFCFLPLDFHGRLRVIRSMFTPGALHGIEASC